MKYRICKTVEISAAHALDLPYDSPCNCPHGHNYIVEIEIEASRLNDVGMVADYTLLKAATHGWLDHQNVDVQFTNKLIVVRSTTEHMAYWLGRRVDEALADPSLVGMPEEMGNAHAKCVRIKIYETSTSWTEVTE